MTPAETFQTLCARCHGEKGNGKGPNAIYLDPAPRDLTALSSCQPSLKRDSSPQLTAASLAPQCPPWGKTLTTTQIQGVSGLRLGSVCEREAAARSKTRRLPDTNPVPMSTDSAHRGESIFLQRCTGCHGRKADGNGPNSIDITPRPRNLTTRHSFTSVSDRRFFDRSIYGVDGTAMPSWMDYGLSHNDVGDIVNFIRSLNKSGK